MAGTRFTTVTKQGRRKDVTTYGTMDSDSSSEAQAPGSYQEAGKPTSKRYRCILYTMIVLIISLALIWILSSLEDQREVTRASLLASMPHHRRPKQDPQYLWMIEHDSNAQDTSLATRRSLYAQDEVTTMTSNACASTMDTSTWILDRASYADLYLGDIFQDPGLYNAVLEADLILCEHAEFGGVPTSQSAQCRLVGNSYFSRSASRSWWPSLKAFDVAVDFSLAIRPPFQGNHRVKPCTCQATDTDTADINVTVNMSSLSLSVECSKLLAFNSKASFPRENRNAHIFAERGDAMIGAGAPGFYVIPDRRLLEYENDRKRVPFRDSIKDDTQGSSYTPHVATKAVGTPAIPDRRVACMSHGISRRYDGADPHPVSDPLLGLWVALGMLGFLSGFALAAKLTRHYFERRARLGVARAPVIVEASVDELDTRPRYVRFLQTVQVMSTWGNWVADRLNPKKSQATEGNEADGPRKLQKTKGTRFEDVTDLRPQVMPPAHIERSIDESFGIEPRPEQGIDDNMDQGSAEHIEGISTAQEHRSRNAATRRSNRSTSGSDGHAENV
ncbi:MAG: hypothetical protein Q9221_000652 [Calogaya cf. arnoldii]